MCNVLAPVEPHHVARQASVHTLTACVVPCRRMLAGAIQTSDEANGTSRGRRACRYARACALFPPPAGLRPCLSPRGADSMCAVRVPRQVGASRGLPGRAWAHADMGVRRSMLGRSGMQRCGRPPSPRSATSRAAAADGRCPCIRPSPSRCAAHPHAAASKAWCVACEDRVWRAGVVLAGI